MPCGRVGGRLAGRRARLVPGLAAVVGALNDLPEPAAGLRAIEAVRVGGRALEVVDLPPGEHWTIDLPLIALAVGREDERAFARPDEDSYAAHRMHSARFENSGGTVYSPPAPEAQARQRRANSTPMAPAAIPLSAL